MLHAWHGSCNIVVSVPLLGASCSKIAEAEAAVSVNEKKWLVMHMHVQLKLDELRGPPNPWLTVTLKVPGQLLPFWSQLVENACIRNVW
jgi:hypothetical protein